MNLINAIILAIIEGLTEFIPVSSTGHMLMAKFYLHLDPTKNEVVNTYIIAVQFGAIMAIPVMFWKKFFSGFDFYIKLAIGFVPAGIIGFTFKALIVDSLEVPIIVAFTLVTVGIVLMFMDDWYHKNRSYVSAPITYKQAFIIGLYQCLALIPGVSRSAATIFGGLSQKLNWKQATEFSFFLAVPTLTIAGGYKLFHDWNKIADQPGIVENLVYGNIISFIIAIFTVNLFLRYVQKIGFRYFGIYRIIIGLIFFAAIIR